MRDVERTMQRAGQAAEDVMEKVTDQLAERIRERTRDMLQHLLEDDAPAEYVSAVIAGMACAMVEELWNRRQEATDAGTLIGTWMALGAEYALQCAAGDYPEAPDARVGARPSETQLFQQRARLTESAVRHVVATLSGAWARADAARSPDGDTFEKGLCIDPVLSGGTHALAVLAWDTAPEDRTAAHVTVAFTNEARVSLKDCASKRPAGGFMRGEASL